MSIQPVDCDTRALILSDLRARRGPFVQQIVAAHEVVAHYGVYRIKITAARALLREACIREVQCISILLFVIVPDPALQAMSARAIHKKFLAARGL